MDAWRQCAGPGWKAGRHRYPAAPGHAYLADKGEPTGYPPARSRNG